MWLRSLEKPPHAGSTKDPERNRHARHGLKGSKRSQ
jgi:hypothetical protein